MTTVQQPTPITPEMLARKDFPKIAFYLSTFAATFMLFAGLFAIFFNSLYLAIVWSIWAGLTSLLIGISLIFCSMFIGGAAASLVLKPEMHQSAGITIILVSTPGAPAGLRMVLAGRRWSGRCWRDNGHTMETGKNLGK